MTPVPLRCVFLSQQSDDVLRERLRESHVLEDLVSHQPRSYETSGTIAALGRSVRLSLQL